MDSSSVLRIALLAALSGFSVANARTLTWEESVRLATGNNAELQAAEATFRSTEALEGVARSGFLPRLSGTLSATRSGSAGGTSAGGDITSAPGNQYAATLSGSQNLFAGFADRGALDKAKANTRAAEETRRIARAKVSFDLKSGFEGLLYAQSVRTLSQDIVKRRESNLGLVQLRFESGRENKGSVLLSKAYLNQAKYEALQATHDQAEARYTLARVVGLDDTDDTLAASGDVPMSPPPAAPDFRKLAVETPDHRQAIAQEAAADAAVMAARGAFFPSLGLSGTYGRKDTEFFPNGPDRWSLGLSLTIPIFDGLKDYASSRSASESYSASIGNRVGVDRGLLVKLRTAFHAYVEAVSKAEVDASFRDAAQTRAEIARTKYNNGLLTFEDWDLIENDLIARQKAYLLSLQNRVTAEAGWEQAQGSGVFP